MKPRPRASTLGFLLRFAVYLVAGSLVLAIPWVDARLVAPWTRFNAAASAAVARMVGIDARADGTEVSYGSGTLNVLTGCNGVEALLILAAAVIAFPAPWKSRLAGVLAGVPLILAANLVRLGNLIVVARYFPERLELFHVYVWQTLIVLIAFVIFLGWGILVARQAASVRP
ncbi:MAG TPA: exosortase H [Candidatus Polarisedimenticolaceae bacterium]|nr:exosortase H [Candidatus Polarisedimenticolaceae bacterium]